VHLVGFIIKIFVTMHGHTNVKFSLRLFTVEARVRLMISLSLYSVAIGQFSLRVLRFFLVDYHSTSAPYSIICQSWDESCFYGRPYRSTEIQFGLTTSVRCTL